MENVVDVFKPKHIFIWLVSAFKAGFINSAGFLATGKFVSHVTGFGTQSGIALGHEDYFFGAELLIIPLSFIFGGVVTSFFLDRKYKKGEHPRFYLIQGLITLLIGLVIYIGEGMQLGNTPFDVDNKYDFLEFFIISSLCFICGLKNSLVTWATFGRIRVTHLTGLSTDIGLNLIKTFRKNQPKSRMQEGRIVNVVRMMTLMSFSIGAVASAIVIPRIGYMGFLVVFGISFVMTIISIQDYRNKSLSLESASTP